MNLKETVNFYKAGYPALSINTKEVDRSIHLLKTFLEVPMGTSKKIPKIFLWDLSKNEIVGGQGIEKLAPGQNPALFPSDFLQKAEEWTIMIAPLLSRYLQAPQLVSALVNNIPLWRTQHKMLILLGSGFQMPQELIPIFPQIETSLPSIEELALTMESIKKGSGALAESARGLTLFETENIIAKAMVEGKELTSEILWEGKKAVLNETAGLKLLETTETLENIKGMENLKEFILSSAKHPLSKGVIIVGHPGTGKTRLASVIAKALGMEGIENDVAALRDRYVGGTEEKMKQLRLQLEPLNRSVILIDEVEKAFAGVESSSETDGGVGARLYRAYLKMLDTLPHYVIATANDISDLPPAFVRSGRWDAIYFVDFPNETEREAIVEYYSSMYKIKVTEKNPLPLIIDWTGAEIESLFRLATIRNISLRESGKTINPISRFEKDKIEKLREWARSRCSMASKSKDSGATRKVIE